MTTDFDKDLRAIQQARRLAERCRDAQREFANASVHTVDAVCDAVSRAAFDAARRLAEMANSETGYGVIEHKVLKNQFAARNVWESIRNVPTAGVIERDEAKKLVVIAEPMGVVAALTPSTNPTSTAIFKSLIALKGRNGIVVSPHPFAAKCTAEAVVIMARAAETAGAPAGLISCLDGSSYAGTQELMKHYAVNLILATGGGPMVRAAHSTGKPAYGVGPGNVPAWVDRSADIEKAARDIVNSKSFDCSLICATEQAVVADQPIAAELRRRMEEEGAYWVPDPHLKALAALLFHPDGAINSRSVGQTAASLAKMISMDLPPGKRVLVVPLQGIGKDQPFSREKLTSVLGFMSVDGAQKGLEVCIDILRFGGDGHSAAIHSRDNAQVERMALRLPAFRIIVNSMSTLGSVGYTCGFMPSMTLGTGGIGGAVVGDNITVTHVINRKRVAWELQPYTPPDPSARSQLTANFATASSGEPDIDVIVARVLARLGQVPANVS